MATAYELTACFAPYVTSYKRFQEGSFAPTGIAWSYDNRTAGFRVVGEGTSLRVECRIPRGRREPIHRVRGPHRGRASRDSIIQIAASR